MHAFLSSLICALALTLHTVQGFGLLGGGAAPASWGGVPAPAAPKINYLIGETRERKDPQLLPKEGLMRREGLTEGDLEACDAALAQHVANYPAASTRDRAQMQGYLGNCVLCHCIAKNKGNSKDYPKGFGEFDGLVLPVLRCDSCWYKDHEHFESEIQNMRQDNNNPYFDGDNELQMPNKEETLKALLIAGTKDLVKGAISFDAAGNLVLSKALPSFGGFGGGSGGGGGFGGRSGGGGGGFGGGSGSGGGGFF